MDYEQRISKTDLARSTHRVIREAQRGYTVLVENHGQPGVAIVDIIDFQLQRAAVHYFGFPKEYEQDVEISGSVLKSLSTDQDRFNLVIGNYLATHISIGRSAERLGMSPPKLQVRLMRSGIPLRMGPESEEEVGNEMKMIKSRCGENNFDGPTWHYIPDQLRSSGTYIHTKRFMGRLGRYN
jgi:predicted HTH domain antitoxin